MKKILASIVVVFVAFSFFSCRKKEKIESAPKVAPITLVMAEVNPPETLSGRMDFAFKEKVEELSGGKIKIDLHCSGILGDNKQVRDIMTKPNSSIQLTRQGPIESLSKTYGIFLVPYIFESKEHFWRFAQSPTAQKLLNKPNEDGNNLIGLFYGEEGFRNLFSTKKISSIADFEGLTMRVTNEKTNKALADSLKMEKKQVNFADLYGALLTGSVDVADQPLSNYLGHHFDEVAPNVVLNSHQLGVMETFITTECWNSLSKENQKILIEAGKYASEFCKKISEEEEKKTLQELEKKGVSIMYVDDIAPWKEGLENFIKESTADYFDLYQEILSYAN